MPKKFLVLALMIMASGCASDGRPQRDNFVSTACGGPVSGFTQTRMKFGDSYLETRPVSEVWANTEFRVRLAPKPAFRGNDVELVGVGPGSSWIAGSGNFKSASGGVIVAGCVPATAAVDDSFKFEVRIDGVGVLDPRVSVIRSHHD